MTLSKRACVSNVSASRAECLRVSEYSSKVRKEEAGTFWNRPITMHVLTTKFSRGK